MKHLKLFEDMKFLTDSKGRPFKTIADANHLANKENYGKTIYFLADGSRYSAEVKKRIELSEPYDDEEPEEYEFYYFSNIQKLDSNMNVNDSNYGYHK